METNSPAIIALQQLAALKGHNLSTAEIAALLALPHVIALHFWAGIRFYAHIGGWDGIRYFLKTGTRMTSRSQLLALASAGGPGAPTETQQTKIADKT